MCVNFADALLIVLIVGLQKLGVGCASKTWSGTVYLASERSELKTCKIVIKPNYFRLFGMWQIVTF